MEPRTVIVTAGRNIGDTPMSVDRWDAFQTDLLGYVGDYGLPVFVGEGRGIGEEAFTVVADRTDGWNLARLNHLRHDLGLLASKYGQECIALTTGTVSFVGPSGEDVKWN